eukprot:gene12383-16611_t
MSISLSSIHDDLNAKQWFNLLDEIKSLNEIYFALNGGENSVEEITIPQIAVFGDQSSGKSSVLESFIGIHDLFPKGTGLVTRCPTHITLVQCGKDEKWNASILLPSTITSLESYKNDRTINSVMEKINSPIDLVTQLEKSIKIVLSFLQLTSNGSNVYFNESIQVKIRSFDVPNLSVIDLPGIIRTTISGQSKSVITEVDDMLENFMKKENTIIVAVIPANQDIATVDILERARLFDRAGLRTIGVLTKPDLVDKGAEEEVLDVVQNKRIPLSLGYVLVKNRNQAELKSQVMLEESLENEENYFVSHDIWSKIDRSQRGRRALLNKLTQIIVTKAVKNAPFIKSQLEEKLKVIDGKLNSLGSALPNDDIDRNKIVMKLITKFSQILRQLAAGEYRDSLTQNDLELRMNFHICELLKLLQVKLSLNLPNLDSEYYAETLSQGLFEMRGRELPGFTSTRLLISTIGPELDLWRTQVDESMVEIFSVYVIGAKKLALNLLHQYPRMYDALVSCINEVCVLQSFEMSKRIDEIFLRSTESASNDSDLIDAINQIRNKRFETALKEVLMVAKEPQVLDDSQIRGNYRHSSVAKSAEIMKDHLKEHVMEMLGHTYMMYHAISYGPNIQVEDARAALKAYWKICEKRLNDDVSAAIDLILLQKCTESIETYLLSSVQNWMDDGSTLAAILTEDENVTEMREQFKSLRLNIMISLSNLNGILRIVEE